MIVVEIRFGRPRRDAMGNRTPIRVDGDRVGEIVGSGVPYDCLYIAVIDRPLLSADGKRRIGTEHAELGWTVPTLNEAKDRVRDHYARSAAGQDVFAL